MGLIGNPMLYQMQASGLSGFGKARVSTRLRR
jgi:hypothetical protein